MTVSPHRNAQRAALWLLYAHDVIGGDVGDVGSLLSQSKETVCELEESASEQWSEITDRVRGVATSLDSVDEVVQAVSPRWKLSRMAKIDRNILRLGAWEILFGKLPPIAVINACVDLGKEYGEKNTPAFVNGLLDQICQDHDVAMQ